MRTHRAHARAEAHVGRHGAPQRGLMRERFEVVLLDIDHRRKALVRLARHAEVQHLGVAVVAAAAHPGQAGCDRLLVRADPAQDLERTARHADGAAAGAVAVVGLDHQRGDAVARQQRRQRQPDRAAAGDQHGYVSRPGAQSSGRRCRWHGRVRGGEVCHGWPRSMQLVSCATISQIVAHETSVYPVGSTVPPAGRRQVKGDKSHIAHPVPWPMLRRAQPATAASEPSPCRPCPPTPCPAPAGCPLPAAGATTRCWAPPACWCSGRSAALPRRT
ncbi:hypothetical protein D9M68_695520 [compost metagenome]